MVNQALLRLWSFAVPSLPSTWTYFEEIDSTSQHFIHAFLPTSASSLVAFQHLRIEPQRDGFLRGSFLWSALSPITFDGCLVSSWWEDVLGLPSASKVFRVPFGHVRIGCDATVNLLVLLFRGVNEFSGHSFLPLSRWPFAGR